MLDNVFVNQFKYDGLKNIKTLTQLILLSRFTIKKQHLELDVVFLYYHKMFLFSIDYM